MSTNDLQQFNELQTQLSVFLGPIKDLQVVDLETSKALSATFREMKGWVKKVDEKVKHVNDPLKMQIDRNKAFGEQIKAPLLAAIADVSNKQLAYERVLEEERRKKYQEEQEAQRKRDDEARAAIRAQQEAAEAKAKAIREEAEMEAMFSKPDEAAEAKARAEEEATRAKAAADAESARIAFEAKSTHWQAKKEVSQHKVSGVRRTWDYEIIDESKIPEDYLMKVVNEKKVKNSIIHMEVREIPGIRIFEKTTLTTR